MGTRKEASVKEVGKELLLEGYSAAEVAEILNVKKDTILSYNKNIWKIPLKKKMSAEEIEIAKDMIRRGYNYTEIESAIGFKASSISDRNLREWHLPYGKIRSSLKKTVLKCDFCGKGFEVYKSKLAHDACLYCSKKCSHYAAIKPESLNKPVFRGYRWAYLSQEIRKEIPFCQRCWKMHKRLTVHHIRPWRLQGDNSVENLIVLCDSCHRHVEHVTKELFLTLGVEDTVELIRYIYQLRMERFRWKYIKYKSRK